MKRHLSASDIRAVRSFLARVRESLHQAELSAIVFGSKARGEARPESDVDLLLVLGRDDQALRRQVFDLAFDVFLDTNVLISPLVLSRDHLNAMRRSGRQLIRDVERDGIAV